MILEMIKAAIFSILSNKLRTFLSMLGITIGVAAVIAVVSIGQGAGESIKERISSLGSNILFVMPGKIGGVGGRIAQAVGDVLSEDDAVKIKTYCPSVSHVTPVLQRQYNVQHGDVNTISSIIGVYPEVFTMLNLEVERGRTFDNNDDGRRVCIIGAGVKEELFGEKDPLGESLYIVTLAGKQKFTVVGVLKPAGQLLMFRPDEAIILPFKTAKSRIFHTKQVSLLMVQVEKEELTAQAINELDAYLFAKFRDENMYNIISQEIILSTIDETMKILNLSLGSIASISLLVGGIGIMNIMLVSVTERTREIGVRKALGATNFHVLLQFLVESVVITVIGGIMGIVLGAVAGKLIGNVMELRVQVTPGVVFVAVGVSTMVGLFFGVFPAYKASRLSPVEALRYE